MAVRLCWLAVVALAAMAGDGGARAWFVGGTVATASTKSSARLDLAEPNELLLRTGGAEIRIRYSRINQIEYGQNVSRRYAAAIIVSPMLLLSKSRKHFVTIGYSDEQSRQQALVLRVDKGDIRAVLASLEARTGRRVEYQDNEARKARKG